MVKENKSIDEIIKKEIKEIALSLKEISKKFDQADMKLDHLIKTNRDDRYVLAYSRPYDDIFFKNYKE